MTDILIYGIVGDEWDGLDAKTLVPMITEGADELNVRINSPGGYVMEGLAIFNALVRVKASGRKVITHIDGLAASMASVIAMAGEEIIMADNALMMIHNPWDIAIGDAAELRRAADKLDTIRDQLIKVYAGQTGLDEDALKAMLEEETWLTAEQALEQKFITSVSGAITAAASDVSAFGFRKTPKSPLLVQSRQAVMASIATGARAGIPSAIAAVINSRKESGMTEVVTPAVVTQPAPTVTDAADVQARIDTALAAERTRVTSINALVKKHRLDDSFANELVQNNVPLTEATAKILDKLAERDDALNIGHSGPARITQDEREKWQQGAMAWLLTSAGVANLVKAAAKKKGETIDLDPGEFRGVSNVQLATESLQRMGINVNTRDPNVIVGRALTARAEAITQTTGDFPLLLENTMHKVVQAAYAVAPDTWSRFCGIGSVSDFRPHNRYLVGSFGALDSVGEAGEFKNKSIPDGAKEKLTASTKGNIINLTRQAIINDDMSAFATLATMLGRAAKLTIEVDVYALINSNPTMNDGTALFHANHGNLKASGAAPTVTEVDAMRVLMAQQKDVSGNDFLDLRPSIWLGPLGLGGQARITNGSQYDPETANKLQRMNIALGVFEDIVDTPRLTGTAWYVLASPDVAPAFEVAFLNGVQEPFLDSEDGWRVDGTEWKVRIDYGVAAVNWRSAGKNAGA